MLKSALITGASSGIGCAFARILAREGYDLVLSARREERLAALKAELGQNFNGQFFILPEDLADPNAAQRIWEHLQEKNIQIDTLINNAGFGSFGDYKDQPWEEEERMLQVNVLSLSHLTKLFLPAMLERKQGCILNVASTAGFIPGPLMNVYYATKAYVVAYSLALANELEKSGVTVTVLCPGATATEFQAAARMEHVKYVKGRRISTAEDVASYGFLAMLEGRSLAIHGWGNKALIFLVRFLPRSMTAGMVRWLQEKRR